MTVLPRLAPGLFVVLWATGFIGARYAMPWAEPFTFLAVRFAITFLIMGALVVALRRPHMPARAAAHAAIAGVLIHAAYLGGVFWAIRHGMPAGLSALVIGLQPLITALLARPMLGETISPRHWLGLAVGFGGVAVVVAPGIAGGSGGVTAPTLAACLLGVVAISLGTVWQKRFVSGGDLVTGTMWQYLGATLALAVLSLALETRAVVMTGELVFAMAWLVLVLSVGAIFLLMYLIREGAMSRVGSLFYLVPAVTALMAYALFGEELSWVQLVGMGVSMAGVALAVQPATRARASA